MPDKLFFPLTAILAALLVLLALQPAMGALPSGPVSVGDMNYAQVTVRGDDLNRIVGGGEAEIDLIRASEPTHLSIETLAGMLSDDPVLGPHFPLAADLEVQFSGFEVTVTVTAKPGEERGATQMMVNYSTGRDGESGWQVFDLHRDWSSFSFTYEVPVKSGENALDYLAIRPVTPDKSRSLLISEVRFDRGQRWAEPPAQ